MCNWHKTGTLGVLFRVLIGIINCLSLAVGILFLILGLAAYKLLQELVKFFLGVVDTVIDIINPGARALTVSNAIDLVTIPIIVFGILLIIVSLLGIFGTCCGLRGFLIAYVVLYALISVIHVGGFIFIISNISSSNFIVINLIAFVIEILMTIACVYLIKEYNSNRRKTFQAHIAEKVEMVDYNINEQQKTKF